MDATTVDKYPKTSYTEKEIEHIRQSNLEAGAKSCTETGDVNDYIITTVWPGSSSQTKSAGALLSEAIAPARARRLAATRTP